MSCPGRLRLLACLFACLPSSAYAADAADILVVGQRESPITIAPRGLSVSLGDDQFDGVNAFNVDDLIKYAPNFFVRSRFIGDNNGVPGFRGTHSTQSARALVMVDGFVISNFLGNSFFFPPAWGMVSPSEVAQFDIVYGPYSARYGGNSMGGIVNITTRPPDRTAVFGTVQGFVQPYRQYATDEDLYGWSAEGGFALKPADSPWSVRVSARRLINRAQPQQYYQFGYAAAAYANPGSGVPIEGAVIDDRLIPVSGTQIRAPIVGDYSVVDTRQDQLRGQLRYDAGDVHIEALFAYWWNREETLKPRSYLRDAAGNPFYGAGGIISSDGHGWTLNPESTFNLGIARKNEWLGGVKLRAPIAGFDVSTNLSTLQFDHQATRQSNGFANGGANGAGQLTRYGPTGWITADLAVRRAIGAHAIAFGAQANVYRTDRTVEGTTAWRTATGRSLRNRTFGRTRTIGVFAEDEIALFDRIAVTGGLRAEFWRAYDGGLTALATKGADAGNPVTQRYDARSQTAVDPKLAVRMDIAADWRAELSLATATRFPTVGELFQGALNGDGSFNVNSFDPGLKPERSRDANLLVRHAIGPVTLTGSLFYQRVRDAIFSYVGFNQNGVSTSTFKNIDLTRQYGVELIAEAHDWPIRGLDVDANAAWIDAKTIRNRADPASEGVQFPRIPRWRINGNARYAINDRLQAVLGWRYASRPNTDLDGLQRGDTYGYTSELFALDAKMNWRPAEGWRLSAGVNNLTNDKAWVFHPYPQRTFLIEAGVAL